MTLPFWKKVVAAGCVIMLGLAVATWSPLAGQDKAEAKAKTTKKAKAPKGRLPAYYGDVVSEEQKQKIYDVQQKFAPQLEDLQAQLEALRKKQSDEIDALLTKEQLDKINSLREAANAKKKKKGESKEKKEDAAEKTGGQ